METVATPVTQAEAPTVPQQKSLIVNVVGGRRSRDGQYIILNLEDGRTVIKHIHFLKSLMGVPFEKKGKPGLPS